MFIHMDKQEYQPILTRRVAIHPHPQNPLIVKSLPKVPHIGLIRHP